MLVKRSYDGVEILSLDINSLRQELRRIAVFIKKKHPAIEQIIGFGSIQKDNFTPHSDIDIAIIVKESRKRFIERQDEFADDFGALPLDVNLVVYTKQEMERMIEAKNSFIQEVFKGVRLDDVIF